MKTNLKNALYAKGVSLKSFAEFLGVSEKSVHNKLSELTEFTYSEVRKTCDVLFPEYKADYLFSSISPNHQTA